MSASLSVSSASRMLADVSIDGHARPKTASEPSSSKASGIVHGTDMELVARTVDAERPVADSLTVSMKELWMGSVRPPCGSAAIRWKCALPCMCCVLSILSTAPVQHT